MTRTRMISEKARRMPGTTPAMKRLFTEMAPPVARE